MGSFDRRRTRGTLASLSRIHLPRCLTHRAHRALHSTVKQRAEAQGHITTECTSCFDLWSCSSCLPAACLLFLPVSVSAAAAPDRTTLPSHSHERGPLQHHHEHTVRARMAACNAG
jgi:hypothetical protein